MSGIGLLVVGNASHGVTRYALNVGRALAKAGHRTTSVQVESIEVVPPELSNCSLIHLHVTDRLFGGSAREATGRLRTLVASFAGRVSMTLHDVPQESDGDAMPGRIEFYRAAVELAAGIVVSSEHEAGLLRRFVDRDSHPEVVPLMIEPPAATAPPVTTALTVGVLGFLYPGKGHIETLRAMEGLPEAVGFVALGTPSPGHHWLAEELTAAASAQGRECEITGFLPDDELLRRMREVTVPVAFHRHLSASGSINTWIAAGRIPLVPQSDYVVELDSRSPGVVSIHPPHALADEIAASLSGERESWIDPSVEPVPSPAEVADRHVILWEKWCS